MSKVVILGDGYLLHTDELQCAIAEIVRPYVVKSQNLSVGIGAITQGDRHAFSFGSGMDGQSAADQIYEIGSVTKVFTAALLADMVQAGTVKLDDPVQRFLPPGVTLPARRGAEITLEHLATHTSGLPRLPANLNVTWANNDNPYADYTVDQLYECLCAHRPERGVPAPFAYSNLGVGLLGHVLSLAAGSSFEDAVRQRLCGPLSMADTVITLNPEQQHRLVPGHSAAGKPVPNWDVPTLAGAGALRSTVHDLHRFLSAHLAVPETPLTPVLSFCHTPRARESAQTQIGLAWLISDFHDETLLWHNGGTGGYSSYVGFIQKKGVAVIVLTNHTPPWLAALGMNKPHADRIGEAILQVLLEASR